MGHHARPKLVDLARRIHRLFGTPERRRLLEQEIAAALEADTADGPTDWHLRRRRHFEVTALEDASLRDGYNKRPDMRWLAYQRMVYASELAALDPRLEIEGLFDRWLGAVQIDPGFVPADSTAGVVNVVAWAPPEFLPIHDPTPSFPLPPTNIGREYRLHELCLALATIHDAVGNCPPFITEDHRLATTRWRMRTKLIKSEASDNWADDLELLVPVVEKALVVSDQESDGTAGEANEDLVTIADLAMLGALEEKTIRNRLAEARAANEIVPEPVVPTCGVLPAKYRYCAMRPLLVKLFPKRAFSFPESYAEAAKVLGRSDGNGSV